MENQEHSKTSDAVRQPLHVYPAVLSLVCPGLGQLVQGRGHRALWLLAVWTLLIAAGWRILDFPVTFAALFSLLMLFGLLLLLSVLFVFFSVLDAATWERGTPASFKVHLTVLTVLLLPLIVCGLMASIADTAREQARRMQCAGKMNQLACAFINYHEVHGSFPPAYTVDKNGKPLHSWRVLILPAFSQDELYARIRLDEPWNSEYNRQFHDVQLSIYQCPSSPRNMRRLSSQIYNFLRQNRDCFYTGNCDYSVVIGEDTVFPGSNTVSLDDITDGTENTILVVERVIPICWMDPNNEICFDTACEGISRHPFGIGSQHVYGHVVNVALASGGYGTVTQTTDGRIHTHNKTYESIQPLLTKSAGDATQEP